MGPVGKRSQLLLNARKARSGELNCRRKFKTVKVKPDVERRCCLVLVEVIVGVGGSSRQTVVTKKRR